jgi:hypothetical protein
MSALSRRSVSSIVLAIVLAFDAAAVAFLAALFSGAFL